MVDSLHREYVGTLTSFIFHHLLTAPIVALVIQEQVQSNKDLDLPTRRELLTQFHCDEIAEVVLYLFNEKVCSVRRSVEAGNVVEGLCWIDR